MKAIKAAIDRKVKGISSGGTEFEIFSTVGRNRTNRKLVTLRAGLGSMMGGGNIAGCRNYSMSFQCLITPATMKVLVTM